jgi:tetratricopeptide (TPR) repeat protein
MVVFASACASMALLSAGTLLARRGLRVGAGVIVPIVFLVLPLLQSIPLPMSVRRVFDSKGTALLTEHAAAPPAAWPLSLDPPATRSNVGKAAAALVAFLIAYHLSSGRSRRHVVARAVAAAGIAAVVVGLAHRIAGAGKLFGLLTSSGRSLLLGPFVNPNHTAELLELSAFACLACSFRRPTALNRFGWLLGMVFCAGGAAGTMSRGAVLAMGVGVLVYVLWRYRAADQDGEPRKRAPLVAGLALVVLIVLSALALGSSQLVDRFRTDAVGGDTRFQLWRDAWRVIAAHPAGIGRGAFDRVFPVYRTMHAQTAVRFSFVENEPLQMLVDGGWIFMVAIIAAFGLVAREIVRHGRRDRTEAALLAGIAAVLAHSLLDFGLETPGVLLPFAFVLGALLGRLREAEPPAWTARLRWPIAALAGLGLVVGIGSVAHGSYDDFDALLRNAPPRGRAAIVERAERVHPVDYFYALARARLEPLKGPAGAPSPRFRALNRALALCPVCESTHVEVARNLWALGRRPQALLEWRTAIGIRPPLLRPALGELFAAGAKPEELASLGATEPGRMIEIADFLSSVSRLRDAMVVLDQAEIAGAGRKDLLIVRAQLQLQSGQTEAATATVARARALSIRDPRLELVDANLKMSQGAAGSDAAFAQIETAAGQYPFDLDIQRRRLDMVMKLERWQAAERALQGLRQALYQNRRDVSEAYLASARIAARFARWTEALGQYRLAVGQAPWNVTAWLEYGQTAETAGRDTVAREAYVEAARALPNDPNVVKALRSLDDRMAQLRRSALPHPQGTP